MRTMWEDSVAKIPLTGDESENLTTNATGACSPEIVVWPRRYEYGQTTATTTGASMPFSPAVASARRGCQSCQALSGFLVQNVAGINASTRVTITEAAKPRGGIPLRPVRSSNRHIISIKRRKTQLLAMGKGVRRSGQLCRTDVGLRRAESVVTKEKKNDYMHSLVLPRPEVVLPGLFARKRRWTQNSVFKHRKRRFGTWEMTVSTQGTQRKQREKGRKLWS